MSGTLKRLGPGLRPGERDGLQHISGTGGLPPILGKWFFVDKTSGDDNRDGRSPDNAFAELRAAYDACTSGAGDGICLFSRGTSASATSSRMTFPLVWSKHAITVIGVSSGGRMFNRARVSNTDNTTGSITTIAFPTGTTITDSASAFVTNGFVVGDVLTILTNDTTNDGSSAIVTAVTAGTLTCGAETFTVQTAGTVGAATISSFNAQLIDLTGDNNRFENLSIVNHSADAASLGSVRISGNRNSFKNVHMIGAGHATPGAVATASHLFINGGQENFFEGCTFGTDSVLWASTNAPILFDANSWRNGFYDCDVVLYSKTSGGGAIKSTDATSMEGFQKFARCRFINWNENGLTALTSAFIGTKPTSGYILMDACSLVGWSAWDSVGANNTIYIANSDATASGAGGIATTI